MKDHPIKFNFFPMIKIKKGVLFLMFCFIVFVVVVLFFVFCLFFVLFVISFCLVSNDFVIATIINCVIVTDIPSENSTNTTNPFTNWLPWDVRSVTIFAVHPYSLAPVSHNQSTTHGLASALGCEAKQSFCASSLVVSSKLPKNTLALLCLSKLPVFHHKNCETTNILDGSLAGSFLAEMFFDGFEQAAGRTKIRNTRQLNDPAYQHNRFVGSIG